MYSMCVYIYIHIHTHISKDGAGRPGAGGQRLEGNDNSYLTIAIDNNNSYLTIVI